jgi:trimethylamine--corrinoid protein Co-methyltransferase
MSVAGQLRLLTPDQMQEVHDKACRILAEKGIVFEANHSIEVFKANGFKVEGNTVYFTKEQVEKAVSQVPQEWTFHGVNAAKDVRIAKDAGLVIHPEGGEVSVQDYKGERRLPTMQDFEQLQILYQALDNVDIAGYQPVGPLDKPARSRGLWCLYGSWKHTDKPVLPPMEPDTIQKMEEVIHMYEIVHGKDFVANNYVTWQCLCPNSPWFFANYACDGIKVYAENNQPVLLVSAPMSGITSPVFLLSTVVLAIAEDLAGLVLAQLIRPGLPVICSASLTYGYMRSASWECASPDTALMLASHVQMQRDFYKLPSRAQTGVTSSKTTDFQAGMETMQSLLYTALAGVNITSQTVGSLANLLTSSLVKTVLDDELIGRVRWMLKGMEVNEEQFGMEDLLDADPKSAFLENDSTFDHFRDYFAPSVSDWSNPDEWEEAGSRDVSERAYDKVTKILAEAPESLISADLDKELTDYIKSVEEGA